MHTRQLAEIIRDALVADSIRSVVTNHRLTLEGAIAALRHCHVARAENIARTYFTVGRNGSELRNKRRRKALLRHRADQASQVKGYRRFESEI